MTVPLELRSHFYKTVNSRFEKCLEPSLQCASKPINAHSIQNARVLSLLERRGHVIMLRQKFPDLGPTIEFQEVGRNQASTFTGFCASHDSGIFRSIDAEEFAPNNPEHLFLLAYRSVTRELYAVMDSAIKIQTTYRFRIDSGLDSATDFSDAGIEATQWLLKSYSTWQYRSVNFDGPLLRKKWNSLTHNFIWLETKFPTVAVSSLFSFDGISREDDVVRCALNIFPVSQERTAVLFSYAKSDSRLARRKLRPVLTSVGEKQKQELSRVIIGSVENFVIAPEWFDGWSMDKKALVKSAFASTVHDSRFLPDSSELMLFS